MSTSETGDTTTNYTYEDETDRQHLTYITGKLSVEYVYENGNLIKTTYANGNTVELVYDVFDRVVEEKYNGTVKYRYVYNGESVSEKATLRDHNLFSYCDNNPVRGN